MRGVRREAGRPLVQPAVVRSGCRQRRQKRATREGRSVNTSWRFPRTAGFNSRGRAGFQLSHTVRRRVAGRANRRRARDPSPGAPALRRSAATGTDPLPASGYGRAASLGWLLRGWHGPSAKALFWTFDELTVLPCTKPGGPERLPTIDRGTLYYMLSVSIQWVSMDRQEWDRQACRTARQQAGVPGVRDRSRARRVHRHGAADVPGRPPASDSPPDAAPVAPDPV